MEQDRIKKLTITHTAGKATSENHEVPNQNSLESRVKKTTLHAFICICILCAAILIKSIDRPFAAKLEDGIATALSFDIDAEETLGRLKFVQMQMEDTVTAFAAQPLQQQNERCMPVQGAVLRAFSKDNDHCLLNVQAGQFVLSPANGIVADVSSDSIAIDFKDGISCMITKLENICVQTGDAVTCGQTIATADSVGTPIAFYVWQDGKGIDPENWVALGQTE